MLSLSLFISGAALGAVFSRVNTRTSFQEAAVAAGVGEYYNEGGLVGFRFVPRGK